MKLKVFSLTDTSILKDFKCGVPLMDDFLHSRFKESLEHHYCKAYYIRNELNEVVAMYALNFDSLILDSDSKEDLRMSVDEKNGVIGYDYSETFYGKSHYPALEISYLAVDTNFQHLKIGSRIIEAILDDAKSQQIAGCQFITVEALASPQYNASTFYYRCGFDASEYYNPNKGTLRMYRMIDYAD